MSSKTTIFTAEEKEYIKANLKYTEKEIANLFFKKFNSHLTRKQVLGRIRNTRTTLRTKGKKSFEDEIMISLVKENCQTMNQDQILELYNKITNKNIQKSTFSTRLRSLGLRGYCNPRPVYVSKEMQNEKLRRDRVSRKLLIEYSQEIAKTPEPKKIKQKIGNGMCFIVNGSTYENGKLDKKSNDIYQKLMGRW